MKRNDPKWLWAEAQLTPEQIEVVRSTHRRGMPVKIMQNDLYEVWIFDNPGGDGWPEMWWLSIKRRDKHPIHDWRHLQRIKNELIGRENEGVELYPAESRKVDGANQYHLFVLKEKGMAFPFGFCGRLVTGPEEDARIGARQRPFEHAEDM